jgi:phosphatidylinositol-3,4,5-trisphosphate 3-phosphatase/dual-specificity protein phosphatase PTEN
MTDFVRRLVSGNKARFKDEKLDLELGEPRIEHTSSTQRDSTLDLVKDLVYITDRVIVMGYPASGVEGLYRNKREDAKRFLDSRHGKNYWVFNFCPVAENSYPASVFDGRVSRYPFPDHQ